VTNAYSAHHDDHAAVRRIAEEYGFCLVKGVFTAAEMAHLEDDMRAASEDFGGAVPDTLSSPRLRWYGLDDRLIALARTLLSDSLVYYGIGAVSFETEVGNATLNPYNKFHIDAVGNPNSLLPYWEGAPGQIYRSYRFAVYLRDYSRHSGGLKVGVKTHLMPLDEIGLTGTLRAKRQTIEVKGEKFVNPLPAFEMYDVPSEPGDVVIWNLRTLHSAGARKLAADPNLALFPTVEQQIFEKFPDAFLPSPGIRNAVMIDYGAPVTETDFYIKNRAWTIIRNSAWATNWQFDDPDLRQKLQSKNIELRGDLLIVALCARLDSARATASAKGLPPSAPGGNAFATFERDLCERLLSLLESHREYAPHFRLLDTERFATLAAQSKVDAVNYGFAAVAAWASKIAASAGKPAA
jgi:hypothetical protein